MVMATTSPASLGRAHRASTGPARIWKHETRFSMEEKNSGKHGTISVLGRAYGFGPMTRMTRYGIIGRARVSPARKRPGYNFRFWPRCGPRPIRRVPWALGGNSWALRAPPSKQNPSASVVWSWLKTSGKRRTNRILL
jgi:hypothetical protein